MGPVPKVLPETAGGAGGPGAAVDGQWLNDEGTAIELICHPDGRVSGTIRFGSHGSAYKPYHLRGTVIAGPDGGGGVVATLLGWPRPSSETVWLGALDDAGAGLETRLMVGPGGSGGIDWATVTGGALFRRAVGRTRSA